MNTDMLSIGTKVEVVDPRLPGQDCTVAGLAFTRDPMLPDGNQRVCYVLLLSPGFWNEGRTTFVSAFVAVPESVRAIPTAAGQGL
jgi:hypothetical protein